jgi:short-subunit dehydrogenase
MKEHAGTSGTALITGASSGIGLELAKIFARNGHDLVLVARRKDALDTLAETLVREHGVGVRVIPKDLSDPAAPKEIHAELEDNSIPVDVLVNNAGFGVRGPFAELGVDEQLEMLQVNVVALTDLTRLFVPDMLRRGRGRVLNLGSTAGLVPGPLMAVYYATKAYVFSFSQALSNELAGSGVTVTVLVPGATRTGFADRAGSSESRLFRGATMDPRSVAEIGYRGLMQGRAIVVAGLQNRALAFSIRLAPRRVLSQVARRLNEVRT